MNKKLSIVLRWGLPAPFVVLGLAAVLFFDSSIVRTIAFVPLFVIWPFAFVFSDPTPQWWANREPDEKNAIAILAVYLCTGAFLYLYSSFYASVLAGDMGTVEATIVDWKHGMSSRGYAHAKMTYAYSVSGTVFEGEMDLNDRMLQSLQGRCFPVWGMQTRPSHVFVTYSPAFPRVSKTAIQYEMPKSNFDGWKRSKYPDSHIPDSTILFEWCWYVPGKGE